MAILQAEPNSPSLIVRRPRLTLLMALIAGFAVSAALRYDVSGSQKLALTPVVQAVLSDSGSPSVGADNPDVTIVVFTDYQCPICRATDPALERLLATDSKVRVIFKDWPIFGARSKAAARAALAAGRQGRYLAMHRALMASRGALDAAQIERVAIGAGVDWPRASADMGADSARLDAQLGQQAVQAWSLGLRGTPAYLVGPYLIEGGLDDRQLARAVGRARKSGPPR